MVTLKEKAAFARDMNQGIALSLGTFTETLIDKFEKMATQADEALRIFKAMALEAFVRIKNRTPVDVGFARAGWRIKVEKWTKDWIVVDMWNEVHYIIFLEYGWSKQAPMGMMRVTLEEMAHRIRRGRKLTTKDLKERTSMKPLKARG